MSIIEKGHRSCLDPRPHARSFRGSKMRAMKRGRREEVYLKTPHLRHGVRTRMRKSTSTRHKTNTCHDVKSLSMDRRNQIASPCPQRVLSTSHIAYALCVRFTPMYGAESAAPKSATTVAKSFGNARGQAPYIPNDYENRKSKQT